MGVSYLIGLLLCLLPKARIGWTEVASKTGLGRSPLIPIVACLVLVGAFGLQSAAFDRAAVMQHSVAYNVPILFIGGDARADEGDTNLVLMLTIVESLALTVFALGIEALGSRGALAAMLLVAAVLSVIGLHAIAQDSPDPYLYVGQGLLGIAAYNPPAMPFPGDLATINRIWSVPIETTAYGPLWILISRVAIEFAPSLAGKLLALRLLGLGAIAGCAVLAGRLGLPRPVVVAVLCNPALYDLFVAGAHNDLFGVDCALWAMVAVKRGNVLAGTLLAVCAGLVKITLLPVVSVAAIFLPSLGARVRFIAGSSVLAIAAYFVATDGYGFASLHAAVAAYSTPRPFLTTILKTALVVAAYGSVAMAVVRGRTYGRAVWSFSALGVNPLGWYLAWSIPYALVSGEMALAFLCSLPFAAFVESAVYPETIPFTIVRGIVVFALIGTIAYAYRPKALRGARA